jgi:hypothetical protein
VTFFPPDPPHDDDDPAVHPTDPWWKPSDDELPALLPIGEVIVSTDAAALILTLARVYRNGVELVIDRRIRRGAMSAREWHQMQWALHGQYGPDDPGRLRYGVALGDGQHLVLDRPSATYGETPEHHFLSQTGGSGGGGEDFYRFDDGLWLWPLPPEGPLEVVAQWPAMGVPESRVVLDSALLLEKAAQARQLWGTSPG